MITFVRFILLEIIAHFKREMAYVIVEWQESGLVSVINRAWLTPKKKEAFWPPCKDQKIFNKIIKQSDPLIDDSWVLHGVKRCMYETDDFEKARNKSREAEDTSNLESDDDRSKRRLKAKKILSSSDDDEDIILQKRNKLYPERPPRLSDIYNNSSNCSQESSCASISKTSSLNNSVVRSSCSLNTSYGEPNYNLNSPVFLSCSTSSNPTIHTLNTFTPVRARSTLNTSACRSNQSLNESTSVKPNSNNLGLDHRLLSLLYQIKEQNDQILNQLNKKVPEVGELPINFPVEVPVKQIDHLNELETFLKSEESFSGMVSYLSSLGGKDSTTKTNRILRHLLTDELATFFNFRGKRLKRPFCELVLNEVIIRAVKKTSNVTNAEVESVIKVWLKHAPQRFSKKRER